MAVLGVFGPVNSGDDVGNLWEPTFVGRMTEIQAIATMPNRYYGVSFGERQHHYLAGMVVEPPAQIPDGLVLREIPAGTYVQFEGSFDEWWVKDGPDWVYDKWMPASRYELNRTSAMMHFVIHGVKDRVTFCVPVREREAGSES